MAYKRDELAEYNPDMLFVDPKDYDKAIVGIGTRCGQQSLAIYDVDKLIRITQKTMSSSIEEAEEYVYFNIVDAWHGENTPIFLEKPA